jgi:release factor glutamine methyltransferase
MTDGPREQDVVATLRAAGCVFAEEESRLLLDEARTPAELAAMVRRRVAGLPLEQILGWVEFCGLRLVVEPGVFVPRRRTEFLVEQAVALARPGATVVDLGCGTGAIGVAVAAGLGRVALHAVDLEPAAVHCAHRNLEPMGGSVHEGDLFAPLPSTLHGRVDLVVTCPPYVPTDHIRLMPPEARLHEPRSALDGGADGLEPLRRIAAAAPAWLAPGGHLLAETGAAQAPVALAVLAGHGLAGRVVADEERGATVVIGTAAG